MGEAVIPQCRICGAPSPNGDPCEKCEAADGADAITLIVCGTNEPCDHDFQGWRNFEDGRGGETFCSKCGLGSMAWTLSLEGWP